MLANNPKDPSPVYVKECRHGRFMYNINDEVIGRSLDNYGEFSELETQLFEQIVKPGMTVLDIGAHIGVHTIPMAKAIGAKGQIIAIEPQRVINQMLSGNIALNGLTNCMALMVAIGKDMGMITVPPSDYLIESNFGSLSMVKEGEGESVPLLTIDSFNLPRCDFIKVDVEGMEEEVFKGAKATLARTKPVIYFDNEVRANPLNLIQFLFEANYRLYCHQPPLFNPDNYFKNGHNFFASIISNNILGIPRDNPPSEIKNFVEITKENANQYV